MTETDDEQLQDPVVLRALRRIGALDDRRASLCPRCGRREVADDGDWCQPCQTDERRAGKRSWWSRQGDYRELRLDHGPREAAARWIAHQLRRGALEVSEITEAATRAGISKITLRRAREQLQRRGRLVIERGGLPPGRVRWRLTTAEERERTIT